MSVDDYLDLFNYAKSINDGQWQAEIIESLKKFKLTSNTQEREESIKELWSRFDDINIMLSELFERLRENEDSLEQYRWKEQIWELKLERIHLSKMIQKQYIKSR